MRLVVLGMSHKTASVEVREPFAVPPEQHPGLLRALVESPEVEEAMILSTCNRVEVYAVHAGEVRAAQEVLYGVLATHRGLSRRSLNGTTYFLSGRDAVHHLLRVTASLDSMVVGEPQVLGQVKEALSTAREVGTIGPVLGHFSDGALRSAKRVRTETGIAKSVVSIGSVAVDLAARIFDDLRACRVLLIGAGKMAEATARSLAAAGIQQVYVSNRSPERARALADRHGWHPRDLTELEDLLTRVDVVVSSTGASRPIIDVSMMERVVRARKYRPLFLVDIALPRDVDPGVGRLDTVYLYNVDDLEAVSQENMAGREQEALHGESLVDEALDELVTWNATEAVKPTIKAIRDRISLVSHQELSRTLSRRLSHLGDQDRRSLEKMVEATVAKILHPTMAELREQATAGGVARVLDTARRLYGVNQEVPGEREPERALEPEPERALEPEPEPEPERVLEPERALEPEPVPEGALEPERALELEPELEPDVALEPEPELERALEPEEGP